MKAVIGRPKQKISRINAIIKHKNTSEKIFKIIWDATKLSNKLFQVFKMKIVMAGSLNWNLDRS